MKKFIFMITATLMAVISSPVLASDAPAPGPAGQASQATPAGSETGTWIILALIALGVISTLFVSMKQKRATSDKQSEERSNVYSHELARISSILLASLIALMTFLLVVGVQNSVSGFTDELFTALGLLGTGLVLYAAANAVRESAVKGKAAALKTLDVFRRLQQLVFVGSIVATVWFVISYAQLVIKPPAAPPSIGEQQPPASQPPEPQPEAQPQPPAEAQSQPGQ